MITFLRGTLVENWPNRLVLDVGGVGYEITVPLGGPGAHGKVGEAILVLTHHHVREQEQTLFGFESAEQRDLFRLLIDRVTGVGPKVAMSILSGMSPGDFKSAVVASDVNTLARIKGLGKKTAERIVLELKDKVGVTEAWQVASQSATVGPLETAKNDALLALISLGYKQPEAAKAVKDIAASGVSASEEILRQALRLLQ
ncbi:MAG: Holliday junction branch migration protein RuvA [Verrucomicrobiales bacterium]